MINKSINYQFLGSHSLINYNLEKKLGNILGSKGIVKSVKLRY